jgi:HAD superfamily hydrolase (TIGR01509 family)
MIQAVIFDLDGLLADTEKLHYRSYREVFAERGVDLDEGVYADHWVRRGRGITDFLRERGLPYTREEIWGAKIARYEQLAPRCAEAMPGAVELLTSLAGVKKRALATSSGPRSAGAVLSALDLRDQFDVIVTNADVERPKPRPDGFLCAAGRLGVPVDGCLVLEDAEKGVAAAHAAGMKCIAVPTSYTRGNDFSGATLVVESLREVTIALIDSLG